VCVELFFSNRILEKLFKNSKVSDFENTFANTLEKTLKKDLYIIFLFSKFWRIIFIDFFKVSPPKYFQNKNDFKL
jgi:hypothetical protein